MARTDLIADTLTIIRNGIMAQKESAVVPGSKMIKGILGILKAEGYIDNFKDQDVSGGAKTIKVYLKYDSANDSAISGLKRVSRLGLRVYAKYDKMPLVLRGFGRAIVSTSKGLMTNIQARERKLGGEVLCYVW